MAKLIFEFSETHKIEIEMPGTILLIRLAIEKCGSASALGSELGISGMLIGYWLRGKRKVKSSYIRKMAELTGYLPTAEK